MGIVLNTSTLSISPEILKLIAEIDEFKGAWRALGRLVPERLTALRHVATIESIGSSTRIEGSQLSNQDVQKLLNNLGVQSFETRDEQEVAGYADVMETLFDSWDAIAITENEIKQLHRDLLKHSEKDHWHRGNYKTSSNSVVAFDADGKQVGVVFETASPFETPLRMTELVDWFNQNDVLHPLLAIGIFTVVFLEIHPFQDGNGRLSRVLTTLLLLKAGYAYVPYSSLESIVERNKEGYYLALRETQGTIRTDAPDWQPWLGFFLQSLQRQVRHLNQKIEQEKLLLDTLPELSIQIIEHVREHGRITLREAEVLTGANRNTLKKQMKTLIENKHLVLHGGGRGAWYGLA